VAPDPRGGVGDCVLGTAQPLRLKAIKLMNAIVANDFRICIT
jgi:hypothetical protein